LDLINSIPYIIDLIEPLKYWAFKIHR